MTERPELVARVLQAIAETLRAQAGLLELVLAGSPPPAAEALPEAACPHPDEAREDLRTLRHPHRFACRACGATINDDVRQEVSHGTSHG